MVRETDHLRLSDSCKTFAIQRRRRFRSFRDTSVQNNLENESSQIPSTAVSNESSVEPMDQLASINQSQVGHVESAREASLHSSNSNDGVEV